MQQPLPELPSMPASGPMPLPAPEPIHPIQAERTSSAMRQPMSSGVPLGRRLRQMVGVLAGGGMMMVVGVGGLEMIAKPGLRPSDFMATIEARTELGTMNQRMGAEPGQMLMTEAQYRSKITEAERSGQAKAELGFQRELAGIQADKERVVQAYATLYQRANIIAQAAIQLETLAQQFRQQLIQMSNGGRSTVIGIKDLFCGLGSAEACESAKADRRSMIDESDELSRGDVGEKVRQLMTGIDDPATFITHEDQRRNGTPALDR